MEKAAVSQEPTNKMQVMQQLNMLDIPTMCMK